MTPTSSGDYLASAKWPEVSDHGVIITDDCDNEPQAKLYYCAPVVVATWSWMGWTCDIIFRGNMQGEPHSSSVR